MEEGDWRPAPVAPKGCRAAMSVSSRDFQLCFPATEPPHAVNMALDQIISRFLLSPIFSSTPSSRSRGWRW